MSKKRSDPEPPSSDADDEEPVSARSFQERDDEAFAAVVHQYDLNEYHWIAAAVEELLGYPTTSDVASLERAVWLIRAEINRRSAM